MLSSIEVLVYLALIGILLVWFLLPLVPAILLYWLFPNTSISTTGVLANFKVNATGAFAGYLVLFAAMMPFVNQTHNYVGNILHPYWTISGRVKVVDKNGIEVHYPKLFQTIRIRTQPEMSSFQDPAFVMTVPEIEKGDLPTIIIEIPDFGTPQILEAGSNNGVSRDPFNKTIKFVAPLVIRETPVNASYDSRPQ